MIYFRLLAFSFSLFFLFFSWEVQAQETTTVIEKHAVVSPPPKGACISVAGHWEGNIWIDTHEVCKYENRSEGVAWINDYWSCTAANVDGTCTTWVFVPGRWVATVE